MQWRIVPELIPGEDEPLVEKSYGDAFEDIELELVLSELAVGRLLVVGAQTDACIRATLDGALARGYDATLVSDAHTTRDKTERGAPPPEQVIAHTNLYWKLAEGAKRENAPEQEPKDAARVEGHPFSILTAIAGNEEKLELAFEGEVIESLRGGIRAVSDRSPAVRRSVEGHAPRPTLGQVGTFGQCLSFATAPKLRDSADSGGLMVAGLTR